MNNKISIEQKGKFEIWKTVVEQIGGQVHHLYEVVMVLDGYGFNMIPQVLEESWLTLPQAEDYLDWLAENFPQEGIESVDDFMRIGEEQINAIRSGAIAFLETVGVMQ